MRVIHGTPDNPLEGRLYPDYRGAEPAWFPHAGEVLILGHTHYPVVERTARCAATNVDPKTGQRDMDIPAALKREYGHVDFGVYALIETAGTFAQGDPVTVPQMADG